MNEVVEFRTNNNWLGRIDIKNEDELVMNGVKPTLD